MGKFSLFICSFFGETVGWGFYPNVPFDGDEKLSFIHHYANKALQAFSGSKNFRIFLNVFKSLTPLPPLSEGEGGIERTKQSYFNLFQIQLKNFRDFGTFRQAVPELRGSRFSP